GRRVFLQEAALGEAAGAELPVLLRARRAGRESGASAPPWRCGGKFLDHPTFARTAALRLPQNPVEPRGCVPRPGLTAATAGSPCSLCSRRECAAPAHHWKKG